MISTEQAKGPGPFSFGLLDGSDAVTLGESGTNFGARPIQLRVQRRVPVRAGVPGWRRRWGRRHDWRVAILPRYYGGWYD